VAAASPATVVTGIAAPPPTCPEISSYTFPIPTNGLFHCTQNSGTNFLSTTI